METFRNKKGQSIKGEIKKILFLAGVVFVLLCMFLYWSVQRIVTANANDYLETSADKLQNDLDYMFGKLENYADTLAGDETLIKLLQEPFQDKTKYIDYVQNLMTEYRILEPAIADIALVSGNMHYSTIFLEDELREIAKKVTGPMFQWVGIGKVTMIVYEGERELFLYGKKVYFQREEIGTLVFSVPAGYFSDGQSDLPFAFALVREEDGFFYSLYPKQPPKGLQEALNSMEKSEKLQKNGRFYLKSVELDRMGCSLVSANSLDRKYTTYNMLMLQVTLWTGIVVILLFIVLFIGVVNRKIVHPLQTFYDIIKGIRKQKQRNLKEPLNLQGCTEIREIGEEFTGMLKDIDGLNKKIFANTTRLYEMELQKQKAELSYLRGQIDPHFLYNTLEVLRKQALKRNAPEIANMAVDMGKIFRYSSKGESVVTLEEELSITKAYVRIQENRFGDRLKVFYMIPEELKRCRVMKMLLQPVVENSIYHGIEPKCGRGSIFIGARQEGSSLLISVLDDGVGIPEEKIEEIHRKLSEETTDTSQHVGIFNTAARIQLMYGKEYGLTVESHGEGGTSVVLHLPILKEEGENRCTES